MLNDVSMPTDANSNRQHALRRSNSTKAAVDAYWNAAYIGIAACLANLVLFNLARRGLPSHFKQTLISVLAFVAFAGAIRVPFLLHSKMSSLSIYYLIPVLGALYFMTLVLANWLQAPMGVILLALCFTFFWNFRVMAPGLSCTLVIIGLIFGFACFLWANAFGYPSVWAVETALSGIASKDTLFHADISAMIQQHKAVSTGLSAFTPLIYYPGSHAVIGGVAALSGVLPLWQYPEAQLIFLIPSLVFSVVLAAGLLLRPNPIAASASTLVIVTLTALFDWCSFLASESYCLSLVLMFLSLPCIFSVVRVQKMPAMPICTLSIISTTLVLAVVLVTKASTAIVMGLLYILLFGYRFVRRNSINCLIFYSAVPVAAGITICLFATLLSYPINLWEFPRDFPVEFLSSMFVIVAGLIALWSGQAFKGIRLNNAVLWAVAAVACVSALPGLIVYIGGGSAYYFIHPVVLISCLPIAGFLGTSIQRLLGEKLINSLAIPISAVLIILGSFLSGSRPDDLSIGKLIYRSNMLHSGKIDAALYYSPEYPDLRYWWVVDIATVFEPFNKKVALSIYSSYLEKVLEKIGKNVKLTAESAFYIPPSTTEYWNLHPLCSAQPFTLPALTGAPLIVGLPPAENGCELLDYGYNQYSEMSRSRELNDTEICRLARKSNFSRVVKVLNSPAFISATIECERNYD